MSLATITADDLYRIASLSDPRFSPDGQWLAYVRTQMHREINDYRSAIWLAPIGGGRPRPFTSGDKRDKQPRWSPDGRWLAFASDRASEKKENQIYLMPTDGGEARRLTDLENGTSDPAWSPDGSILAFVSRVNADEMAAEEEAEPATPASPEEARLQAAEKARKEEKKADPRVITRFAYRAETKYFDDRTKHLYVVEIDLETGSASGKPRRLTQDPRNYSNPRWLPDGSGLLATVDRNPGQDDMFYYSDVVRVPLDGGDVELLTGPDTADEDPRPSPDGRWIAYRSRPVEDLAAANTEVKVMLATGGETRILTAEMDSHAQNLTWAPDGRSLLFLVPERGRVELRSVPFAGGAVETLVTSDGLILDYDLSGDGRQVGFIASTDRAPWDLYCAGLDGSGEKRLTEVNAELLAEKALAEVKDHWFTSADGTDIQGWILMPPSWQAGQKAPTVLSIHGGPHVMWSRHEPTMWHEWQLLAASGYLVFACNPRGSDGYGRDFRAALIEHWGEADLPDLQAGLAQLIARGDADAERLVVTGGSYGGFMTTWVIGHDQRFKAAVAQRGVYDLFSFYGTTDIPRFTERELGAAPWEDPQKLWRYSPIAYVQEVRTPLLLIHSENDYRAPIPAAEGMFVALRRLEREVELVRYPRDGHELSRSGEPRHRLDRLERMVEWFDRHLNQSGSSD